MTQTGQAPRPGVLCVDDDPALLDLLDRHLRTDYDVSKAAGGEEALAMLASASGIAVVVADMNMPRMDGVTLLARVRQDAPTIVRVMLTGESDQAVAAQAINSGQIFRFLAKSCTREQLRRAISDAVEQHHLIVAERTLLESTLLGAIQALMDTLAVVNPVAFGRAQRIRRLAVELARIAGLQKEWSLEAAALLSQLGHLAVPQEALERLLAGGRLTNTERRQVDRVPAVTCELLRKIPRLEPVIDIISGLDAAFRPSDLEAPTTIDILRVAADFDRYFVQTGDPRLAIDALRAHLARYSPALLPILAAHIGAEIRNATIREVSLHHVTVGMVLIEELRTDTGALVVPAEFEVTHGFLERLNHFPPGVVDKSVRVRIASASEPAARKSAKAAATA